MTWISGCIVLLFVTPERETPVFNANAVVMVKVALLERGGHWEM